VADPDLQIRRGDIGHPDLVIRGGGGGPGLKKDFFRPSGLSLI